ncbi:MAG TPA: glycosyltransferase family 4 protein, partial [Candidatus Baltobacteraceae bacterium]|nr:glycosyltransferase family 4 protein [Candidatus Baltobacteraceae bacterium]
KCGAKLLQYMAAGLPTVTAPVGVNREIVTDGATGFLAASPDDWRQAIQRLAEQENLREAFGRAGRKFVVKNYSIARWAEKWVALLNDITRQPD